ncbi:MAG: DUF4198 domain-containing protein [Thermodesulfobacteriota bacterium]
MKSPKIILPVLLIVLFLSAPVFAHHLWVTNKDGLYAVNRGMISERIDAYDPDCVQKVRAYGQDGKEIPVQRINEAEQVKFKTETTPAMTRVVSKWGDRVNTTRGKKLMSREQAENEGLTVISTFFSTQFSKTLFESSSQNRKPLDMKFEIVPLQDPLAADPNEPVPFQLLFEGKPLADTAIYTNDDREIKTDENGVARIACGQTGAHLLYAKHRTPPENDEAYDYLKFMTFLTFEVKQ